MLGSAPNGRREAVSRRALPRVEGRAARAARGAALRRHLSRRAARVPRPQSIQRRAPHVTADFIYYRLRKPEYSPETGNRLTGSWHSITSAPTASSARAPDSSPLCAPSRTSGASSCRTNARTAARRKAGCGCCGRHGHSSSPSFCSTRASRSLRPTASPTSEAAETGSGGSTTRRASRASSS